MTSTAVRQIPAVTASLTPAGKIASIEGACISENAQAENAQGAFFPDGITSSSSFSATHFPANRL
jgi:hypothetical protein